MEAYDIWNDESELKQGGSHRNRLAAKRRAKPALPHPGQSYNPDPEDHQRLLKKIADKELQHMKAKANIKKATDVNVNPNELRQHELQEMFAGIHHLVKKAPVVPNDQDSDGDSTDSAYSDYNEKDFEVIAKDKKVLEKRKSKKQRMAQLRDKLQRKAAKLRKLKNVRSSRFDGIKKILKELDSKEKETKPTRRRKKLGYKLPEPDPIYCLESELPSSLRQTSCPMDALVREQLESFQSRLMVEPTKYQAQKQAKYKKKQFERE